MKEPKTPLSIKLFKTKKYISDKRSDIRHTTKKIKENPTLLDMIDSTKRIIRKFLKNFKENGHNWMDRLNSDDGFIIDS